MKKILNFIEKEFFDTKEEYKVAEPYIKTIAYLLPISLIITLISWCL